MNKIGHINVTKRLSLDISRTKRFWMLLGSIMPDILVHTYITGHKWDTTFDKSYRRLLHLENWGGDSWLSYYRLGYVLHYIEDYFTYPHNSNYEDDMKEHIKYENNMASYILAMGNRPVEAKDRVMSVAQLRVWLNRLHDEYMQEAVHNAELDYKYISRAAKRVADSMAIAFERNENKGVDIGMDLGLDIELELELELGLEFDLELEREVDFALPMKERI